MLISIISLNENNPSQSFLQSDTTENLKYDPGGNMNLVMILALIIEIFVASVPIIAIML